MAATMAETSSNQPQELLDSPAETSTAAANNGALASNGSVGAGFCYDDLFPALPEMSGGGDFDGANNGGGGLNGGAANGTHGHQHKLAQPSMIVPAAPKINRTEFFQIPTEERRLKDQPTSIGVTPADCDQASEREKRLVYEIGKDTVTSIELTTSKSDGVLSVVINGRTDKVQEAKMRIIKNLVQEAQMEVVVPREHHRHVLGSKAQRLRNLEAETGTRISVPRPEDASECITIRGPREGIEEARNRIQTLSDELSKHAQEAMDIEKKYHVFILGPNNKTVESIRSQTGARIRIPPLSVKEDTMVVISGEKEGVAEAKRRIVTIYTECRANVRDTSMQVPKEQHKYILGRGGQTLQDMFEKTGVWIEVPPQESDSCTVTLLGEPAKLGQALSLVYEKANSVIKVEMQAPVWLHKYLIGKKGENINRIRENFKDAFVEFADNSTIRLEGPRDSIEAVRKQLQDEINSITSNTSYAEVRADPSYHPHIIGKSGSNVNRLKQELNVKIHIPSQNDFNANGGGLDVITIEGEPEAVKKAKQELEEMVRKLKNEASRELKVESRLHGLLIGPGGEKIQEVRKKFNQVNIAFPDASRNMDHVTIRGDKADVDRCYKHLSEMVKELMLTNYKADVTLFKQFVKYLCTNKGKEILKSIQQEASVRIGLPKEGASYDQVTVTGEEAKVDKAKRLLLEAQRRNSDIVESTVMIPNKLHGAMLKNKRNLLNSILEEAGCNPADIDVQFPPNGSNSDKCNISGPKDMVEKAKKRLVEEANERALASYTEEVKAKAQHHRFLIGRQGANIRKLREKTSARVIFPSEDSAEDRETIVIMGHETAVKAARKELEAMIAELENITEDSVSIPLKHHKHFVARRGEVLTQIAEDFGGVQVSFPKSSANSETVTLKGAKECVAGAKQRLLDIAKELDAQVTITVCIPQIHHRAVMGAKGVKVQGITKEFNVQIKFPERAANGEAAVEIDENGDCDENDPRNLIVVSGLATNCEGAKKALEAFVPVTIEVPVDAKLHRFIIGQKGRDVRELMDRYDVNVKVPQSSENIDFVRVTGTRDNVEKCRLDLEDRIKQLEADEEDRKLKSFTLTLDVPAKHHPKIVGRRGAVVTKLRERHDVQIHFPKKDDSDGGDSITISGYEKNAYAARDEILSMVGELEEMITKEIKLDRRIHSRIIGARGRNVRKIMDDHKVDIKFPREDDPDPDMVTITGLEDNVEEAINVLKDREDELMDMCANEAPPQQAVSAVSSIFSGSGRGGNRGNNQQGFVVNGAPWSAPGTNAPDTSSQSDFPSFGGSNANSAVAWGPRR